jgi:putative flippase GtrA
MLPAQANRLAILIPAYRPSDSLLDVVRALAQKSLPHIVVVDDGSGPEFRDLFTRVAELPGVELLRHATNLGKGAALKTGLNHLLCRYPGLIGVVTADADGQHHPDDIQRVAESLVAHPESLVLGCRTFRGEVPLRSRIGNVATSAIMHALMGRKMSDTQTGLRGIPEAFAPRILRLEANGYEFELEMLLAAHRWGIPLVEEPIRTIYQPGNPSSHFNPIVDSMKIYFILLRFGSVSLLTALLDNLVFILALHQGGSILLSQALGRTVGLAFNYTMVRSSVFYSHQRHKAVLPKYLLLALVSGTASYGGIRLLSATLGIATVPAKLAVESLLFLVNFAVQRLFIFKPEDRSREPEAGVERSSAGPVTAVVVAVFLGALAMEAHGFLTANLFSQDIWDPIGVKRFLKYIGMFLGVSVPLLMMAPWSFAGAIVALTAVGTAVSIGPLALLAVAFYLISSCALGSRLLGSKHGDDPESQLFATLLGAAAWILLMTLVARIPVNYPAVWAALLAIPVLLDIRGAWRRLGHLWRSIAALELRGYAERAAFAVLVFVLLAHWFVALTPEKSADGLAMHLAIPANIAVNHAMTYQPSRIVWSVMPMGADFSYAIVYLMGGEYAVHLLDYALLLLLAAVLYFALRRWVCRAAAFWLLALFASTPLVQLVTGSLFIENMLAAMVLGTMAALWRFGDTGEKRFLYLSAALGGTAMATKFGALAFVALAVPFLAIEAARHWKSLGPRPAAVCGLAAVLLVGLAAPPYAIAYAKTGDPLFPFLDRTFHPKLLPPNAGLVDLRFNRPLTWNTLYDLTFRTHLTYEGRNGSFGFQYLALAPLGLAALLLAQRRSGAGSAAIVALGAAVIIMRTQPNARYLYAALPLLSVPFAVLLAWAVETRWLYRGLLAFVVACIAMNLRFMPSASYYHRDFCLRLPFSRAERDRYRAEEVPIREVIEHFNREHTTAAVMLTVESAIAGLNGDIYENHWHQITTYLRIREMKTVPDMVRLMQSWNVEYFISPKPGMGDEIKPAAFKEMLERCTTPVFEQGSEYLGRLEPTCRPPEERIALLVRRGSYDDFDPALVYRGDWNHDRNFAEPDLHTISFTDVPGSEVEIAFEGKALTYVYTKAENRGIASVMVDGVEQGPVDLYSAQTQWQRQTRFCCFASGRHTAILRLTGRANPQSKGTFIDLDSFTVE